MIRRKLVTLSLFAVAAALYATALVSTSSPAQACAWVCTGGSCPGGKVAARNTCGGTGCVSFCITE